MEWFRWYGGTFNDPKLQWVASKSCQTVASVLAVWVTVLERAHDHETRGCCEGLDFESLDVSLGLEDGATHDIYQAMIRKAMISDGDMVANWEKRQPKSEDIGAAERKRAQREREKLHNEIEELKKQLAVTQSQNVTAVTECHGMSHEVTTEERRLEEKREEEPLKPQQQQQAREQVRIVGVERRADLERLFPDVALDVALEKLMNRCRGKPCLIDPYESVLKWLQTEFKPVHGGRHGSGSTGRTSAAAGKARGIVPPNGPGVDWAGDCGFTTV